MLHYCIGQGVGRGFIHPEDAAPSVIVTPIQLVTLIQLFSQYAIRHAVLAKTTTRPIAGFLYAAQKLGTAQRQFEILSSLIFDSMVA
jgi:hypothetical protein